MTQYKTLNVKLSNSQLNKLKSRIKNGTTVNSYFSSNVIVDSNDETNFPHKLLFTDTQVSRFRKAFQSNSSANTKLLKTQLFKMVELGESSNFFFTTRYREFINRFIYERIIKKPLLNRKKSLNIFLQM